MPLSSAAPLLIRDLNTAFTNVYMAGIKEGANSDEIIKNLSTEMGDAIHKYMVAAHVTTTDIITPGQSAAGPFGAGIYSAPGSATGTGSISFKPTALTILKNDLLKLFKVARDAGLDKHASSDTIIRMIASDMKTAIHNFAVKADVQTNIILAGGVPVVGYLTTTPPPIPFPSISGPGKGTGTGALL
jgi:hypothetical protein